MASGHKDAAALRSSLKSSSLIFTLTCIVRFPASVIPSGIADPAGSSNGILRTNNIQRTRGPWLQAPISLNMLNSGHNAENGLDGRSEHSEPKRLSTFFEQVLRFLDGRRGVPQENALPKQTVCDEGKAIESPD
jgi:hypothetical protein